MSFSEGGGFGGFREDEEDLDALLARPALPTSTPSFSTPFTPAAVEDDLNFNAFADPYPTSPRPATNATPPRPSRADSVSSSTSGFGHVAPYSPPPATTATSHPSPPYHPSSPPAHARRRSSVASYSNAYTPAEAVPPSLSEQTPFGEEGQGFAPSPPLPPVQMPSYSSPYSPPPHTAALSFAPPRQPTPPPPPAPISELDLSTLLGEEKPILPSFSKKKPKDLGVFGETQRQKEREVGERVTVLPVGTVGRQTGGRKGKGALAALLGLETEPTEEEKDVKQLKDDFSKAVTAPPPPAQEMTSSLSTPLASPPTPKVAERAVKSTETEVHSATEPASIPLPESRPITPISPSSRLSTPSVSSRNGSKDDDEEEEPTSEAERAYATFVSPLYTGDSGIAPGSARDKEKEWPGVGAGLTSSSLSASTSTSTSTLEPQSVPQSPFAPSSSLPSSPSSTSPVYRPLSPPPPPSSSGFINPAISSNGSRRDDNASEVDSLKGQYTRSVEVSIDEGDSGFGFGPGSGEDTETLRPDAPTPMTSPPLPSIPAASPSLSFSSTPPSHLPEPAALRPNFIITVGDPQKIGSTLNVTAQHTVYTVRTQTTSSAFRKPDFSVLRRFSHFLWLFEALTANNPGVIVPGMPEKNAIGRFGSEFVENRRSALQATLMKITQHPMLVGDPDLRLFLESDNLSVDIKQRKISAHPGSQAEKEGWFASIGSVVGGSKFIEFDEYFDVRRQTLETFELQLRSLLTSLQASHKVRLVLSASLSELSAALAALSACDLSGPLRKVLEKGATLQAKLMELGDRQSESEEAIGGLVATAEGYARLCGSVKLVFGARIKSYHAYQASESTLRKAKSTHEKAKKAGRAHSDLLTLGVSEVSEAERRVLDAKADFEDVSKLTKAEMARFDKEKVEDFKRAVVDYVDGLVNRQREVVRIWEEYNEMLIKAAEDNSARFASLRRGEGASSSSSPAITNGSEGLST